MPYVRNVAVMAFLVLLTLPLAAAAETRYVSDQLVVTLRQQPADQAEVIATMRTDTPLEILAEEGRYLQVRIPSGEKGYVLSQYVTSELPKPLIIARLQKELAGLQQKLAAAQKAREAAINELQNIQATLAEESRTTEQQVTELQTALDQTRRELQEATERYDTLLANSREVVNITNARNQLEEDNARLNTEIETIRQENKKLLTTGMIQWFLAGGGVFLIGWLVGKLSRKRRSF
ncbi:TIGR04211 family SH3 domain-containing protein [Desulfuromonas sp. KJ2020]|uniref:TIGR04211 family SH3 domain-containing protein n=1 Tax=Desulfuromonas sp. KJ2020 TaxID=2919173 RepID=UPI0020A75150|nr:TIGR04211 family SH3 domain-containing protein [Desulfuromonas sp. KJ2020]MCP3176065.1 TIGR04211 family SH3 domain-containing protein [Desulfuromonas sp. KJ2020]